MKRPEDGEDGGGRADFIAQENLHAGALPERKNRLLGVPCGPERIWCFHDVCTEKKGAVGKSVHFSGLPWKRACRTVAWQASSLAPSWLSV